MFLFYPGLKADLIRDAFKRSKYQDVILPLTVLRRIDCVLEPTKQDADHSQGTDMCKSDLYMKSADGRDAENIRFRTLWSRSAAHQRWSAALFAAHKARR